MAHSNGTMSSATITPAATADRGTSQAPMRERDQIALAKKDIASPCIMVSSMQARTTSSEPHRSGVEMPKTELTRMPRPIPKTAGPRIRQR